MLRINWNRLGMLLKTRRTIFWNQRSITFSINKEVTHYSLCLFMVLSFICVCVMISHSDFVVTLIFKFHCSCSPYRYMVLVLFETFGDVMSLPYRFCAALILKVGQNINPLFATLEYIVYHLGLYFCKERSTVL